MRGWSDMPSLLGALQFVFPAYAGMAPAPYNDCLGCNVFPAYAGISQRKKDMTETNPDRILKELDWEARPDGSWQSYHAKVNEGSYTFKRSLQSTRKDPPFLVYFASPEGNTRMIGSMGTISSARYRAAVHLSKLRKGERFNLI